MWGLALACGVALADPDRRPEVVLTAPYCDVCSAEDKAYLAPRSPIVKRVIELIDGAQRSLDVAQFTFSVKEIEAAVLRAHQRGVAVRLVIDASQQADSASARLAAAGVPARFVTGKPAEGERPAGLQHNKFVVIDQDRLATGSNNWSSTGTSINEEAMLVLDPAPGDPLLEGFRCHFDAMWAGQREAAGACSRPGVAFAPGSAPIALIKDAIRQARSRIDVLMHHLLFDDLVKELAKAAERGVVVRVVVNAADRAEAQGKEWDRLAKAGGQLRFKRTNQALYQLTHHKLVVVDGRVLVNGSGNWSGSAFFNNFENYVRYEDPSVVAPFAALVERLWAWSLSAASLDAGLDPAAQDLSFNKVFFGSLHAHFFAGGGGRYWDDGRASRKDAAGSEVPVPQAATADAARFAYTYARDAGRMDFLALTPHTVDDRPNDPADIPSFSVPAYENLRATAEALTRESSGRFLALAGFEWSTNATGNHVNVLGASQIAKVERGRFDLLWGQWLPERAAAGERVLVQLNHPKTFPEHTIEGLPGTWDQITGRALTEISNAGERKQKFNDYGLDDYGPLREALPRWVSGQGQPDAATVAQSFAALEAAARPYARLLEITLGRGSEIGAEVPVNPDLVPGDDGALARDVRTDDWEHYLLAGWRLAPTGNGDNHYANWGTGHTTRTGVVAPALTEAALLEAIDQRRVFATEDPNLAVRIYADGRVPMGGQLTTRAATVALRVDVRDPDHPGAIQLRARRGQVGGAAFEDAASGSTPPGSAELSVALPAPGLWVIYAEVHETGPDRMAWSAPIWVERLP